MLVCEMPIFAVCKRDISYLTNLPKASEKLQIFEADLSKAESFNTAIQGCVGVFHLAHPIDVEGKEAEEIVTKRALEGTLGILKACLYHKNTVKRIVYTSSVATILFNNKAGLSEADETIWSDFDVCRTSKLVSSSYLVSKTIVEKTALEFADKYGLDLVSVVLPVVTGPFLCPNLPSSVYMSMAMLFGTYVFFYTLLIWCYVYFTTQLNLLSSSFFACTLIILRKII